jgi:hypothetical protein
MQPAPFGYGYEPPESSQRGRPAVIMWYRVYASVTLLLYVGFLVLWMVMSNAAFSSATPNAQTAQASALMMLIVILVTLFFGFFYVIAALVPYKPWGWTVGLIAICLGISSCMLVAAIPLLIYWMKPETKAAFGRL